MTDASTQTLVEPSRQVPAAGVPLCVDLDGTLIRADTLAEGVLELLRRNPAYVVMMIVWLLRGKANFKAQVTRRAKIDVLALPANHEVLEWLKAEKARGRRLYLCTGASAGYGQAVAERFGLFDRVLTSDSRVNLTAARKAARLVEELGPRGFDYVGNAAHDLPVWRQARAAIVVAPTLPLALQLRRVPRLATLFPRASSRLAAWLRAARPHHWTKNALIFVPALAAQAAGEADILLNSCIAFIAFSLAASSIYIKNDLLDLSSDRAHPTKRHRPFANGDLQASEGVVGSALLLGAALALGYGLLDVLFLLVLCGYILGTAAYSFAIKQRPIVDILWLAGLYTGRIVAGSAATGIEPSFWLLAFSMFLFLSLAAAKRFAELAGLEARQEAKARGRGYSTTDLPLLLAFGVAAAYTSVLILAFYVYSRASELYAYPQVLWLISPALLYWVSRIWLKAHRRQLHEDPLVFAFRDPPSLAVGITCATLIWLAV